MSNTFEKAVIVGEAARAVISRDPAQTPIFCLPVEVLMLIFEYYGHVFQISPLELVCRDWHAAIASPSLWRMLDLSSLDKPLSSKKLSALLKRSKYATINLSLPVPRALEEANEWWQAIIPHMSRVERLSIDMGTENLNLWCNEALHQVLATPAPSLQRLHIAAPSDRHLAVPIAAALHGGKPANLNSLVLRNVKLPDGVVTAWGNLTDAFIMLPRMTRRQVYCLLKGSPRLAALSLVVDIYTTDDDFNPPKSTQIGSLILHGFIEGLHEALADFHHACIPRIVHKNGRQEVAHFWPTATFSHRFSRAIIYPHYTLTNSELVHVQYATSDGSVVRETACASPYTLSSQLASELANSFWRHLRTLEILEDYWPEGTNSPVFAPQLKTIMLIVSKRSFDPSETRTTQMDEAMLRLNLKSWTPYTFLRPNMPTKRLASLVCPDLRSVIVSSPWRTIAVDELPFDVAAYSRAIEEAGCEVSARRLSLVMDRLLVSAAPDERRHSATTLGKLVFRGVGVDDVRLLREKAKIIKMVKFGQNLYDFEA